MLNDIAERTDLNRLADDGCPHISGETQTFDLEEAWFAYDEDYGDGQFAPVYESVVEC